jgi:hypothetical protein
MKPSVRLVLVILAIGCAIRLAAPAVQGAHTPEVAAIVPVSSFAVGNALCCGTIGSSYGYSLNANGITDYWDTSNPGTINFVVFVYPGQPSVTQRIGVQITSPSGAVVASNTFASQKMGYEGDWFSWSAKGNFSAPGVYTVTASADHTAIGHIPLVFTKPGQ